MVLDKKELDEAINRIKDIVPKKSTCEALQGILVDNGYLIANNMETEIQVKLKGTEGEHYIIPVQAFALIGTLPPGDVEITGNADKVEIAAPGAKATFSTRDPGLFPKMSKAGFSGGETDFDSEVLTSAMKRVLYACAVKNPKMEMTCVCMESDGTDLNVAALDGYQMAWTTIHGAKDTYKLLIPRACVEAILKAGIYGAVKIRHGDNGAVFLGGDIEISTRLNSGKFFDYKKIFQNDMPIRSRIDKNLMIAALNRVKACKEGNFPLKMEIHDADVRLSLQTTVSDYHEELRLEEGTGHELVIGLDNRYLLEALKSFGDVDVLNIEMSNPRYPVIISAEIDGTDNKSLVLPVNIREQAQKGA